MKFEQFEKEIKERGYGIVAMNHYSINKIWHTYCVVLGKDDKTAFKVEATNSEEVFKNIFEQIISFDKFKN